MKFTLPSKPTFVFDPAYNGLSVALIPQGPTFAEFNGNPDETVIFPSSGEFTLDKGVPTRVFRKNTSHVTSGYSDGNVTLSDEEYFIQLRTLESKGNEIEGAYGDEEFVFDSLEDEVAYTRFVRSFTRQTKAVITDVELEFDVKYVALSEFKYIKPIRSLDKTDSIGLVHYVPDYDDMMRTILKEMRSDGTLSEEFRFIPWDEKNDVKYSKLAFDKRRATEYIFTGEESINLHCIRKKHVRFTPMAYDAAVKLIEQDIEAIRTAIGVAKEKLVPTKIASDHFPLSELLLQLELLYRDLHYVTATKATSKHKRDADNRLVILTNMVRSVMAEQPTNNKPEE